MSVNVLGRIELRSKLRQSPVLSKMLEPESINGHADKFLNFLFTELSEGKSISFKPLGHLVLRPVKKREVKTPNSKAYSTKFDTTVRMRQKPQKPYIKSNHFASVLAEKTGWDLLIATATLDVWMLFLEEALKKGLIIQLRGFGRFSVRNTKRKPVLNFSPYANLKKAINS
jgi:nucleoid DNA-binding protein